MLGSIFHIIAKLILLTIGERTSEELKFLIRIILFFQLSEKLSQELLMAEGTKGKVEKVVLKEVPGR